MYHLHLFHDALERHPIRGRWLKALWIAGGKQTPTSSLACPSQPSLPTQPTQSYTRPRSLSISAVFTRRAASTRYTSFPLLGNHTHTHTARDPTFDLVHILQHCPNLRHLALVGSSLLASALQAAPYPFRLHTLLLDPPICLKFSCMAHLSMLQVLRVVGIPEEKLRSWREWCGEVWSLQRLRTLELVVQGPNDRSVVSITRPAASNSNNEPPTPTPTTAPSLAMAMATTPLQGNAGEKHRDTAFPSELPAAGSGAGTSSATPSGTSYKDNEFCQQWTIDRAEEIVASCLDF